MIREVATPWGTMRVEDRDVYVGQSILTYGEFSPIERRTLCSLVRRGDVVLDIGANIGGLTLPLAEAAGYTGHVLAFEPQRQAADLLLWNVTHRTSPAASAPITLYAKAVGRAAGAVRFPDLPADGLMNVGGIEAGAVQSGEGYEVETITIDSLGLSRCDLIKCDVEGMEPDVLEGARDTIARCRPTLYLEADRAEKRDALFAILQELGYRWTDPEDSRFQPPLYDPDNHRGVCYPTIQLVGFPVLAAAGAIAQDLGRFLAQRRSEPGGIPLIGSAPDPVPVPRAWLEAVQRLLAGPTAVPVVSINVLAVPNERSLLAAEAGSLEGRGT